MGDILSMGVMTTKTSFNSVIELFSVPDHVVNAPKWAANHIKRLDVLPDLLADGLGQFIYGQSLEGKESELTFIYDAVKKTLDQGGAPASGDSRSFLIECMIEGQRVTLIFNQVSDGVEVSAFGYSGRPILLPNVADFAELHQKLTMRFARKDIVEQLEQLEMIKNPSDAIVNILEMKDQLIVVYVLYAKFRAGLTPNMDGGFDELVDYVAENKEIRKAIVDLFTCSNSDPNMVSHNYRYCVDECKKAIPDNAWCEGSLIPAIENCYSAIVTKRDDAPLGLKKAVSYSTLPNDAIEIEYAHLL